MPGWNGSHGNETGVQPGKVSSSQKWKSHGFHGILLVSIVGAAIVGLWLAFSNTAKDRLSTEKEPLKRSVIAEIQPQVPKPKAEVTKEAKMPKLSPTQVMGKRGIPIETYGLKTYWTNGVLRYEGGLRVYDPNRPSKRLELKPSEPELFKRSSLNAIASVINLVPGELIVGEIEYGEDFVKDFNDSLSEPIEYDEKDTEYQRQVKDAVKEVQKQLHEMMNRGEDIAEAMNEARADLQNLSRYRQEIMALVNEQAESDEAGEADVEDIVNAANALFREKGVKEIEEGDVARWGLILEQRRHQDPQHEN